MGIGSKFSDHLMESLKDDEFAFHYIKEALEESCMEGDRQFRALMNSLEKVAKARGIQEVAEKADIPRQSVYRILKEDSNPSFKNICSLLNVFGLKISVEKIADEKASVAKVADVAEYIKEKVPTTISTWKLQKIVFYAQAEHLMNFNHCLFEEKIEAWANGPVVRELYDKHRGRRNIQNLVFGDSSNLSRDQKLSIDWTIEKYGEMSGEMLSRLTHAEDPWKNARKGIPEGSSSDREISPDEMKRFYSTVKDLEDLDEQCNRI